MIGFRAAQTQALKQLEKAAAAVHEEHSRAAHSLTHCAPPRLLSCSQHAHSETSKHKQLSVTDVGQRRPRTLQQHTVHTHHTAYRSPLATTQSHITSRVQPFLSTKRGTSQHQRTRARHPRRYTILRARTRHTCRDANINTSTQFGFSKLTYPVLTTFYSMPRYVIFPFYGNYSYWSATTAKAKNVYQHSLAKVTQCKRTQRNTTEYMYDARRGRCLFDTS